MGFFGKLFNKNKSLQILAPTNGEVVPTSQVKDETFSKDMIGKGFAIIPIDGHFMAPMDGEITLLAETGHAFSIKNKQGIEILVHIGLDTVNINSQRKSNESMKGFNQLVKVGSYVKAGTPIVNADLDFIKKEGFDIITPVIVLNDKSSDDLEITMINSGKNIAKLTPILEINKK
jgi:glucose-specific phosphotransferase system IIA component